MQLSLLHFGGARFPSSTTPLILHFARSQLPMPITTNCIVRLHSTPGVFLGEIMPLYLTEARNVI